jgi:hypothetical protein
VLNLTGFAALTISAFVPLGVARVMLGLVMLALKGRRQG